MSLPEARTGEITRDFVARDSVDGAVLIAQLHAAPATTVVVPVHNGGPVVLECLESVRAHTRPDVRIVVIDDGTTDDATLEILRRLDDRFELFRNDGNLGYTRTVNRGLSIAGKDDVILLNSDTVVGPLWLQRLRAVAYSRRAVASVSAVSDNAGAYAVPAAGQLNEWPTSLPSSELARFIGSRVQEFSVEAASAHGFCMYIRRDAIDAIGTFDEENFPRGYGEENDWSMRALAAGMSTLVAPRVFVRHAQGASFGSSTRQELIKNARQVVDALHPSYTALVRSWAASPAMSALREEFTDLLVESRTALPLPRTLYVIHAAGGGTPQTNLDLMNGLASVQESFLLVASERKVTLFERTHAGLVERAAWTPAEAFSIRDDWRGDYAEVLATWLVEYSIELVHIRHLINQPIGTVSSVTKLLGLPLILSTHDFYYVCPSVHLLDVNLQLHETCVPGRGVPCLLPTPFTRGAPAHANGWIEVWQDRVRSLFDACDRVIATTRSAADIYLLTYPELASKLQIIEHGRDLDDRWTPLRQGRPRRPGPLRIACPARWDPHKGTAYVAEAAALTGSEVEWHILGDRGEFIGDDGVAHGRYERDSLREVLDQIDPDFIGLFSIYPETYSHTLTEAWALGIPVVATDRGAVADRIRDYGGGHLFDPDSPAEAARFLVEASRNLDPERERITPRDSIRSVLTMCADYEALYSSSREGRDLPTVGYVMHGMFGNHPASAHVRLRQRFRSPALAERFRFRPVDGHDLVHGVDNAHYDVILIQRNSLPAGIADAFIARCREKGVPILLEIDDDLFSHEARTRLIAQSYDPHTLDELAVLLREADAVTVSTPDLGARIELLTGTPAVVVVNDIDERAWVEVEPEFDTSAEPTVLYMGSPTHSDDLELLRPVFDDLRTADGRRVHLEVVGVTFDDDDWFRRLVVPRGHAEYSRFAAWLRSQRDRWRVAVAPLAESAFNEAKSDLKLLEYSRLGLAVVASRVGPYAPHGDHGVTTVDPDPRAWRAAILRLVEDDAERERRRRTLADYVARSRTLGSGESNTRLADLLSDLIAHRTIIARPPEELAATTS